MKVLNSITRVRFSPGPLARSIVAAALALGLMVGCSGSDSADEATSEAVAVAADPVPTAAPATEVPPTPVPTATAVPPTAVPPSPVPTAAPTPDPFEELPNWSGLQWGEVRAKDFEPRVSFVVPEGIGKVCTIGQAGAFDFVPLRGERQVSLRRNIARMNVVRLDPTTVDETVAAIAAEAGSSTPPTLTSIGGATGLTFDAATGAGVDNAASVFNFSEQLAGGCEMVWAGEGTTWRFWVVDVAGEVVTIGLFATDGDLEGYAPELQPVLDSIVWQDLDTP